MNIIVILAPTIASKYTFSASRRVLDEMRDPLAPHYTNLCFQERLKCYRRAQGLKNGEDHGNNDSWMTIDTHASSEGEVAEKSNQQEYEK